MSAISQIISSLFGGGAPALPDGYWSLGLHFDGTSGTAVFTDTTGKTVTPTGGTLLTNTFAAALTGNTISGLFNNTLPLSVADHVDFDMAGYDFSIGFWLRPRVLTTSQALVGKSVAGTYSPFALWMDTSGFVHFTCSQNGTTWAVNITASIALSAGAWQHVAACRVGNVYTLYIGGVSAGTATVAGSLMVNTAALIIGGNTGSSYLDGCMDDLIICKKMSLYQAAFTVPSIPFVNPSYSTEYLVVAGGGGGGSSQHNAYPGAGGGAGGMLTGTTALNKGTTYAVTVGLGGASDFNGQNSVIKALTAYGGGRGVGVSLPSSGGSGGGDNYSFTSGAAGTAGQGNAGGAGSINHYGAPGYGSGGGGGAGAAGGDNTSTSVAGVGGAGLQSSITGASVYYAGGGGGGCYSTNTPGGGGAGGGGAGNMNNLVGYAGTANTGGGGGGGGGGSTTTDYLGGAGGSGVVIVRWADTLPVAAATTGSPTYSNTGGFHIYKFTASGSITP